jgi:outer membrane protein assembly factor BamB
MLNGCRERTSYAREEASLRLPFDVVVDYPIPGEDPSSADSVLYVPLASDSNIVVAYDTRANVELWRFGIPSSGGAVDCVPAVGESLVYCGGQDGFGLYALDRVTGEQRWFAPVGDLYTRNPILDGDRIYIIGDSTYCLDAGTGATIWSNPYRDQGTPAVDDSSLYLPSGEAAMALNKFTGEIRWTTEPGDRVIQALAVSPPFLYVYRHDLIKAVDVATGQVAWTITPQGEIGWLNEGAISVSDSALFYVTWGDSVGAGGIYCHDRFTGEFRWNHVFDSEGAFAPTIANGVVYVTTWDPERALWAFDERTGVFLFTDSRDDYSYQPIVSGHTLFAPYSGGIRAFGNSIGVDDEAVTPDVVALRNYPNPCRDMTWIPLALRNQASVRITLFDLQGRQASTPTECMLTRGVHALPLETGQLPAGSYVYRVDVPGETSSGCFVVVK